MLYHLVHCHILQKFSVFIAILTIVKVCTAVSIGPAILYAGKRHSATLTELRQLPLTKSLLLLRERCIINLKRIRIGIGHKVTLRRAVSCLYATQPAGNKFLSQEVWNLRILRL